MHSLHFFFNLDQVSHFRQHAAQRGSIHLFDSLVHTAQAKRPDGGFMRFE